MLRSLQIQNFALINEVNIEPGENFNVLTGETGAGKSLLMGALGLILGKRVDYSMIFDPANKCVVEAVFCFLPGFVMESLKGYSEFDYDNEELVIRREASANGKSRAFINDTPVSLQVLKEVTGMLVDLHGQHENQQLLDAPSQLRLLDSFAGITEKVRAFGKRLRDYKAVADKIALLEEEEKNARQQLDYYRFQFEELAKAELDPDEEERIESELSLLRNADEIREALGGAVFALNDDDGSVINRLSEILISLKQASRYNEQIAQQVELLESSRINIRESVRELEHLSAQTDADPATLARLEERSDLINRLKMKFSCSGIPELIDLKDEFEGKIKGFESLGNEILKWKESGNKLNAELVKMSVDIEDDRKNAIPLLCGTINSLLAEVGLENALFDIRLERIPAGALSFETDHGPIFADASGINRLTFLIRTNAGMPLSPLAASASGGEISRIMLAIKAALAEKAELSVLIFDEIDTGISGETANKVGRVMQKLARNYQVIAITHLPQIAGKGNRHFLISKKEEEGKTISGVRVLAQEERILEIAKMISGENPSESAIKSAGELISSQN